MQYIIPNVYQRPKKIQNGHVSERQDLSEDLDVLYSPVGAVEFEDLPAEDRFKASRFLDIHS